MKNEKNTHTYETKMKTREKENWKKKRKRRKEALILKRYMKTAKLLTQSHTTTHQLPPNPVPPVATAAAAVTTQLPPPARKKPAHLTQAMLRHGITKSYNECAYKVLLNYRMKNTRARYRAITYEMRKNH